MHRNQSSDVTQLSTYILDLMSGLAYPSPLLPPQGGAPFAAPVARPVFTEANSPVRRWPGPANTYSEGRLVDPSRLLQGQNAATGLALGYNEIRNFVLGLTQPAHPADDVALQYFRFARALARALATLGQLDSPGRSQE